MISPAVLLTGLALLLRSVMAAEFYNNSRMVVEVDPYMRELANKDLRLSPILLDAKKNGLFPSKILTVMVNPHFIGGAPPGIPNFMFMQLLLKGLSKKGMVYPLFTKEALRLIGKDTVSLIEDCVEAASAASKSCKNGYKKVTVTKSKTSSSSGGNCGEVVTTMTKVEPASSSTTATTTEVAAA